MHELAGRAAGEDLHVELRALGGGVVDVQHRGDGGGRGRGVGVEGQLARLRPAVVVVNGRGDGVGGGAVVGVVEGVGRAREVSLGRAVAPVEGAVDRRVGRRCPDGGVEAELHGQALPVRQPERRLAGDRQRERRGQVRVADGERVGGDGAVGVGGDGLDDARARGAGGEGVGGGRRVARQVLGARPVAPVDRPGVGVPAGVKGKGVGVPLLYRGGAIDRGGDAQHHPLLQRLGHRAGGQADAGVGHRDARETGPGGGAPAGRKRKTWMNPAGDGPAHFGRDRHRRGPTPAGRPPARCGEVNKSSCVVKDKIAAPRSPAKSRTCSGLPAGGAEADAGAASVDG